MYLYFARDKFVLSTSDEKTGNRNSLPRGEN